MSNNLLEITKNVFRCILGSGDTKKRVAYASTPITKGTSQKAKDQIEMLRSWLHIPLISPMEIENKYGLETEWGYEQWMDLWYWVIDEYVDIVYMCDGWRDSRGCMDEYVYAKEQDIDVFIMSEFESNEWVKND